MTKYFSLNLKSILVNPHLIFWSIVFVEFWVFMWAYIFSVNIPEVEEAVREYLSLAYGSLIVISLSSVSITISQSLIYSSKSIKLVTKYTRLSPSKFLIENFTSSFTVLIIISMIMFASTMGVFWNKFGMLILPKNVLGLAAITVLSAIFIYAISAFLSLLLVLLRAPKSASFITFIPMMLSFIAYSSLWVDFQIGAYISPFNCISSLCYHYFSGKQPLTGAFFMPGNGKPMDVTLTIVSLIIWTLSLLILAVVMLRKIKGVGIEEIELV
ncbi:hypothetical protein J7L49_05740 [Candidatus Bathyarchaeota archaeon]|nr:hypothetical protein [Candidatus Bathyarchaeota archaeon]